MKAYTELQKTAIEWIRQYPSHWSVGPLKFLMTLNPSKTQAAKFRGRSCSFVPMEKLKLDKVDASEIRAVDEVIESYTYFENGDVLAAKVTPCFENKNMAVAKDLINGVGFGSSEIYVMRPLPNVVADFLFYRVQENEFIRLATAEMTGAGGLKRVPADFVQSFKIAIPPLSEQKQIARFLRYETAKIDALIDEQKRLVELLKEKRQAVISHAVTKGLNPDVPMKDSGVEWLGKVPEHWELKCVKHLFRLKAQPAPQNNNYELLSVYTDIGVKPRRELEQKGNKASTTDGYWRVKKGDIIVNKLLAWMGAVGMSDYDGVTSPAYDVLERIEALEPYFYHLLFRNKQSQNEFKRWSRGIMEMRLRLYFDQLGQIYVPYPPVKEQKYIVQRIQMMESTYSALTIEAEKQVKLLSERRSALISAAVTGKIDVRDWQPPQGSDTVEKKESVQTEMLHG